MINNKPSSKIKKPQHTSRQAHSAQERLTSASQSKLFKKLSMSFYNWATKTNEKQIVCDNYDTPVQAKSIGEIPSGHGLGQATEFKLESKKKKKTTQHKLKLENPGQSHFNEYYFEGMDKCKKQGKFKGAEGTKPREYSHFIGCPREVTQIYYRRYMEAPSKNSQQSLSLHRTPKSRSSKKSSTSKSKLKSLRKVGRKLSEANLKKHQK